MIELVAPSTHLLPSYLESTQEMISLGEQVWEAILLRSGESPDDFVRRILSESTTPSPGFVPATTYWAVRGGQVVGRIALRHELNDFLKEYGGHIGYEVRPTARRTGIATEMLRLLLGTKKAMQIGKLLVTCAPDNIGSNRAILANGGVFEKSAFVPRQNRQTNYYWITV